uniref:Androgen-induced gene 1 protein n=1 Tax=Lygus hesperus TaxID=30085 RepID=A0A146LCA7_LYGHE
MGSAGVILHVSLLVLYAYVTYVLHYGNKDNPLNKQHKALEVLGKFSLRYLTNWTFGVQLIYFAISVLGHLIGVIGASRLKTKIHNASDYIFMSIATPMALVVSIVFWVLYAIDRELVFPKVLDLVIPVWVNQSIHSINSVCAILDMFIINHKVPPGSSSVTGLLMYLLTYSVCLFGTYFQTGIWLYPVLKELNWPMRIGFALATSVLALMTLGFTRVLNSMIWDKTPAGMYKYEVDNNVS